MRITQLDNFGEGFTVKPRKPHKAQPLPKRLTLAECQMPAKQVVKARLLREGYCDAKLFGDSIKMSSIISSLRSINGLNIKAVKKGCAAIGYQLISGQ